MKKVLKGGYSKTKDQEIKEALWNTYDFDRTMSKFVFDEPFYSYISCKIHKYKTDKIQTAGVTVKDGKFVMYYNEKFFNGLSWRHRQGLIKHELLHLVFNHVTSRFKKLPNGKPDPAWFWACDFAINSLIPYGDLPPNGLVPGRWPKLTEKQRKMHTPEQLKSLESFRNMVKGWTKGKSADWYYKEICKNRKDFDEITKPNGAFDLFDDHDGWKELSTEEKEIIEHEAQEIIKEAATECDKNMDWGSIPKELKLMIKKMISNQVNWKSLLRQFIGNSRAVHFSSTIKKINRRYEYIHAGKRRSRSARILVAIDQSGSVNQESLGLFFGELDKLAKLTEFVVIPFDAGIVEDKIFKWKKGEKLNPERVASGGTDFNIPTKWANKHSSEFDAIIFMTDGFCGKPIACKIRRAWVVCAGGRMAFETQEMVIPMNKD